MSILKKYGSREDAEKVQKLSVYLAGCTSALVTGSVKLEE